MMIKMVVTELAPCKNCTSPCKNCTYGASSVATIAKFNTFLM
jgi:hypothetical protein